MFIICSPSSSMYRCPNWGPSKRSKQDLFVNLRKNSLENTSCSLETEKFCPSLLVRLGQRTSKRDREGIFLFCLFSFLQIIFFEQKILTKFVIFSRTLTAVYDALLEDLVYPVEIVGKRVRVKLDSSQLIKVHLDKSEQTNIEHKVFFLFFSCWGIEKQRVCFHWILIVLLIVFRSTHSHLCTRNWLDVMLHSSSLNLSKGRFNL